VANEFHKEESIEEKYFNSISSETDFFKKMKISNYLKNLLRIAKFGNLQNFLINY
jgi:hypothetical protein